MEKQQQSDSGNSAEQKDAQRFPFIYDAKLKRPACVLLQAAFGGTSSLAHRFDSRDWLVSPTPDMRGYMVTLDEIRQLARATGSES